MRKKTHVISSMAMFALLLAVAAGPSQAEVVVNEWQDFAFPVFDTSNCAGEDGFATGLVHIKVATMPKGNLGIHVNANGIVTGIVTGNEWLWRDTINDVLPLGAPGGQTIVYTFQQRLKIIGPGQLPDFRLKVRAHITLIDGDVHSNFFSLEGECKD